MSATAPHRTDVAAAPASGPATTPRRWVALVVVLLASFMQLLDGTITNLAIPKLQRDLHATDAQVQLVLAGYLVGYASLLVTGGRLGDTVGRRRMFGWGMTGFVITSALCAFAQSGVQLDTARLLQGISASAMLPQVLAILQVLFPASDGAARAKAFGLYGLTLGLPSILGPFIGGAILDADIASLGWRPIFLVNVPIGLVVLALLRRTVPESRSPDPLRMDPLGVVLATVGLVVVVGVVVQGRQLGWPAWSFGALAAGVVCLLAFAAWERARTDGRHSPLLPTTLFGDRAFSVGLVSVLLVFAGFTPLVFFFSLYLQFGMSFSPLGAGVAMVPFAAGSMITSIMSAVLAPKLGRTLLTLGSGIAVIGLAGLWLTIHLADVPVPHGYYLAPALFVAGLGMGCVVAPLVNVILGGVRVADVGAASGALNTVTIVAGGLGVAVFGIPFFGKAGQLTASGAASGYTDAIEITVLATGLAFAAVLLLTLAIPGRPTGSSPPAARPTASEG